MEDETLEKIKRRHEHDEMRDSFEAEERKEAKAAKLLRQPPDQCVGCTFGTVTDTKLKCMFPTCQRDAMDKILKRGQYREKPEGVEK